jgi:hypothetical protein
LLFWKDKRNRKKVFQTMIDLIEAKLFHDCLVICSNVFVI